jgi:aldose 1-epimerase
VRVDPARIETVDLTDGDVRVRLLSLGCITQDWQVPLAGGHVGAVLGYATPADYLASPVYMGVIAGPVANRLTGARVTLDGQTLAFTPNEGTTLLHSGQAGLHRALWRATRDGDRAVQFHLTRAHLEDGFPGTRRFAVSLRLDGARLRYEMTCTTDRPTLVNLAQHSYYSLGMTGPLWDARLTVAADRYTPTGPGKLPTGEIAALDGLPFDFRVERRLAEADPNASGLDLNYALTGDGPASTLRAPNGLRLRLWTDRHGLQLYTGAGLSPHGTPLSGQTHAPFHGLCLEPQGFPDAPNIPAFPSIAVTPDRPYRQVLDVEITEDAPR